MREDSYATEFWRKQANWVVVGVFVFMLTSLIDYRWIRWGALPMYLAGIVFLILTKFIGTKVYGARSWLHLGPINFQPAQLAVVAGIMVLALFLSQFREMHPMLRLLLCGAIAAAPCLLILMQPDLGEVIIWGPVLLALLFVGGIPLRYLICMILIVTRLYPHRDQFRSKTVSAGADHRVYRIRISTNRARHGRSINRSSLSVRVVGRAKGSRRQTRRSSSGFCPLLPCITTTFSPPSASNGDLLEECFLSARFALLLLTCLFVAFFAGDQFGLLLVIGITALIFTHIFQNIGMTISLLPITGVPLPLISYSGSFVLMIMFGLGIVNSVWIHRKIPA